MGPAFLHEVMGTYWNKKNKHLIFQMPASQIGVAGFELATSASLRRRSNQAEPHPEDI